MRTFVTPDAGGLWTICMGEFGHEPAMDKSTTVRLERLIRGMAILEIDAFEW